MFKVPEQYRLTKDRAKGFSFMGKEIVEMITDDTHKEDGYFFLPAIGKKVGGFYLVRCTVAEGWRLVAANIPSQGRTPSWEEMHYIKNFFFEENDVVWSFHPGKNTYIVQGWIHLLQPVDEEVSKRFMPPVFQQYFTFRRASFFSRLWRVFKRRLKDNISGSTNAEIPNPSPPPPNPGSIV